MSAGEPPETKPDFDPTTLSGRNAQEVLDVIVNLVRPHDGTQDADAARVSLHEAQIELLTDYPDADLSALTPEQIDLVLERYIAWDVCLRIELDVGKSIMSKAPDAVAAVRRLDEIKDYVFEKVAACFRQRRQTLSRLNRQVVVSMAALVVEDVLRVFEEYVQ